MKLIDTSSEHNLYESLANVLQVDVEDIQMFIMYNCTELSEKSSKVWKDSVSQFVKHLNKKYDRLVPYLDFELVTLSHLTTRSSRQTIEHEPLCNLFDALTNDTELKKLAGRAGLEFIKNKKILKVYYLGKEVKWEAFFSSDEGPTARMVKRRLEGNSFYEADKCVNGFLFGGDIHKNHDVSHIKYMPEIIDNILNVLGNHKAITQWKSIVSPCIVTFAAPIDKIIFDEGGRKRTIKQTKYSVLRYCLYFLSCHFLASWSENSNPKIRLDDFYNVQNDFVLKITSIS